VLDGRASAEERARLLAEADGEPELLALIADSAAGMESVGMGNGESGMGRRRAAVGFAGALLAAAAGLFFLWPRSGEIVAVPFPVSIAVTDLGPARMGASLASMRGDANDDRLTQSAAIGSRLVDYQALRADTARETAAVEIANTLRAIPGGSVAAVEFERGRTVNADAVAAVEAVVDVRAFRAAEWLELIRLAAISADWKTLTRRDVWAALGTMSRDVKLSPRTRQLSAQLLGQLKAHQDHTVIAEWANQALAELSRF
jgi:hypothetical protein